MDAYTCSVLIHCTVVALKASIEYFDKINRLNTPIGQKSLISPTVQCCTQLGTGCSDNILLKRGAGALRIKMGAPDLDIRYLSYIISSNYDS